jgi:hypothetical protein
MEASATPIVPGQGAPFASPRRTQPRFTRWIEAKPGSSPPLPEGATRIDLHSAKAKMLARIELKVDPDTALRLQKQFSVTPQG